MSSCGGVRSCRSLRVRTGKTAILALPPVDSITRPGGSLRWAFHAAV